LEKALANFPDLNHETKNLLQLYPPLSRGFHRINFEEDNVSLTLIFDDVDSGLDDLQKTTKTFDAWFLDGFSPRENPKMWSSKILSGISNLSHSETTLSSFSAASIIKKSLEENDFNISLVDGYKHKRHMIKACSSSSNIKSNSNRKKIAIVGAGISGSCLANSLAKRGHHVTVFEKNTNQKKGIPSFVGNPNLSHANTPYGRFLLASYLFFSLYYSKYCSNSWNETGVIVLKDEKGNYNKLEKIFRQINDSDFIAKADKDLFLSIGLDDLGKDAFYFPKTGWLKTQSAINELLKNDNIKLKEEEVIEIKNPNEDQKELISNKAKYLFDEICLCNSFNAKNLIKLHGVNKKRGQITEVKKPKEDINLPICGQGYISPYSKNNLLIGSSYSNDESHLPSNQDDEENLLKINQMLGLELEKIKSHVSFRFTTKDHLPLLGYKEGLILNLGHGSKGSVNSPLCAEIICDFIDGDPLPIDSALYEALNPNRFNS